MSGATDPAERLAHHLAAGQAALDEQDHAAAVTAFRAVHALMPADLSVAMLLANALRLAGEPLEARAVLTAAAASDGWRVAGTPAATLHAFTAALVEAGAPAAARPIAEQVLARMPADPAALGALAAVLRLLGHPERAWPLIDRAVRLRPRVPELLVTAAQVRHDLRDLYGADRFLMRAEALRPAHAPTRLQRAYASLMQGASAEGWALFESRPLPVPHTTAREWQGEPLEQGTVLVTAEQGVGDQFQFVRFVDELAARGAGAVRVQCHADAVTLFRANGWDAVPRDQYSASDWHVPMMSLPHRLGLGAEVRGARVPYLRAPAPVPIPRAPGRRTLGLVWAGNPAFPGGATRDLDPAVLPALVTIPGVQWWSLQYGAGDATLAFLREAGVIVPETPADWEATANLLASLDGLVTTDTGIAHLAGAMGVRTWVLLQHVPDWRWGLEGDTTPWYPSVTLVRPGRWNDWTHVVAQLVASLEQTPSIATP